MKIPSGQHVALFHEQQRVVGDRIRLDAQRHAALADQVEAGAHHLRLAAKGIGILDPAAVEMRSADGTAGQQFTVLARHGDLTGLATHPVNALIERCVAALQRIDRHGARNQSGGKHVFRTEETGERERRRHLGAIDERQTFLGLQLDGFESRQLQTFRCRQHRAAHAHSAHAQQRGAQVRQRGEIARGADRTLCGDQRVDLTLEQRHQRIDELLSHTGMAARQGIDLERQNQAYDRIRQGFTDAGRMRQDEVPLQQFELFRRNARLRKQAEAGVDAIGRIAGLDDPVDQSRGGRDALALRGRQSEQDGLFIDGAQVRQREVARPYLDRSRLGVGRHHARPIIGRFMPCSRAQSMAIWYPASACRITPVPGSFHSTRPTRFAAAVVPSQTTTTPECCE